MAGRRLKLISIGIAIAVDVLLSIALWRVSSILLRRRTPDPADPPSNYGLDYDIFPKNAGENASFFGAVLREATQKLTEAEPLLIVIDALDEADPTPPGRNWLHLPSRLPKG